MDSHLLKQINKSDNPSKIIGENIGEFLDEFINYLEDISRKSKKKKSRKNDPMFFDKVVKYLNMIVTCQQIRTINEANMEKLNKIFTILFHPDTITNSKTYFLNTFKHVLEMFSQENVFQYFKTSIYFMIPYNYLMKNSSNIEDYKKLGNGFCEIMTNEEFDEKGALILFKQFISFLFSKWQ